ncbi:hypothetical protein DITRI_Ditri11bG0136500 [Diplodiscus trichospermus]
MSNQPAPTRPWFRLASMARPAPQAPAPTPEPAPAPPRPATVRPAFRPVVQAQPPPPAGGVSSVPTSPVAAGRASPPSSPSDKKPATSTTVPVGATTSSVPSSPVKTVPSSPVKPVATTTSVPTSPAKTAPTTTSVTSSPTQKPVTTTTRVPSPKALTTTVKPVIESPIQSPKTKPPTAPLPSPLTLPPPQLKAQAELESKIPVEAEQKTVLVQKTIDKPKGWHFGAPQKDLGDTHKPSIPLRGQKEQPKDGETKQKGHGKKFSSDSEDAGMRVITIAGENKGAFMELFLSPHKNGFQGRPYRLQKEAKSSRTGSDGSDYQSYSSSDEEGDRKMKGKSNTSKTMPMNAFMNSNVQGINNSIVFNSSCTHHDPGVHLSLHRKPTGGGFHVRERNNGCKS